MTLNMREAEQFLSVAGSDCGIANVTLAPPVRKSAALSVVKRKPVADAKAGAMPRKAYMRRQTNTINFSRNLPLAQGIRFDL